MPDEIPASISWSNSEIVQSDELYPGITPNIFTQRINNHYNLRNINHFETLFVRTIFNGKERVPHN